MTAEELLELKRKDCVGIFEYNVQINNELICTFTHKRSDGLAVCLEKASKEVTKQKFLDEALFLLKDKI